MLSSSVLLHRNQPYARCDAFQNLNVAVHYNSKQLSCYRTMESSSTTQSATAGDNNSGEKRDLPTTKGDDPPADANKRPKLSDSTPTEVEEGKFYLLLTSMLVVCCSLRIRSMPFFPSPNNYNVLKLDFEPIYDSICACSSKIVLGRRMG